MRRIHGNYRRKHGKRAGRKPLWYVALARQRDFINRILAKFDNR